MDESAALEKLFKSLEAMFCDVEEFEEFESSVMGMLMHIGRKLVNSYLSRHLVEEAFCDEEGRRWRPAVRSNLGLLTSFGEVSIERCLFRAKRNAKTHCPLSESIGLIRRRWSPRAARLAAWAGAELSLSRAAELFRELGGMRPSSTSLHRLESYLGALWEEQREVHEESLREQREIPAEATCVAVSLDGVMINMVGSDKAAKIKRAKAKGSAAKGPSGYKEASTASLSFYDAQGKRLRTVRHARMPQSNKSSLKAWLRCELEYVRKKRPELCVVAIADGAANNWSFLSSLSPDHEVVDFYHTAQHLHARLSKANGASTL